MATRAASSPPAIPGTKCLTAKDLSALNELLAHCADTQCMIDTLASLGLDLSNLAGENTAQQALAAAIKQNQFPGSP